MGIKNDLPKKMKNTTLIKYLDKKLDFLNRFFFFIINRNFLYYDSLLIKFRPGSSSVTHPISNKCQQGTSFKKIAPLPLFYK